MEYLDNHIDSKLKLLIQNKEKSEYLRILLAASGGVDSMVMADIMTNIRKKYNLILGIVHFNHHLRSNSDNDENLCKSFCLENKIIFYNVQLNPNNLGKQSIEAWGRKERYNHCRNIAQKNKYNWIFTAHHLDDQLETFFMKQLETDDVFSLTCIREKWDNIFRPLLDISKSDIIKYAIKNNVNWNEDSSNNDLKFYRNKVRHKLLPKMVSNNPELKEEIITKLSSNRKKSEEISLRVNKLVTKGILNIYDNKIVIDIKNLSNENELVLKYILKYSCSLLVNKGISITRKHLKSFQSFINRSNSNTSFQLGSNIYCYKLNSYLILFLRDCYEQTKVKINTNRSVTNWGPGYFTVNNSSVFHISTTKRYFSISIELFNSGLYVRSWNFGDRIVINKSGNTKKLSKLFNENKILPFEKKLQPVVVDSNDVILWLPGFRHSFLQINEPASNKYMNIVWNRS